MKIRLDTLAAALLSAVATTLYHNHFSVPILQHNDAADINPHNSDIVIDEVSLNSNNDSSSNDELNSNLLKTKRNLDSLTPSKAYKLKKMFHYDDRESGFKRKTESYMPYMPSLDGYMSTHSTYRFLTVREQVLTVIGEAKHGLWREQDNGIIRLYRKYKSSGVPVGANVYDSVHHTRIKEDYKAVLIPGVETSDDEGWAGYRYAQEDDKDGRAAFVDVDIYHPYFEGKYDNHPVIDLPQFICTMSDYNYTESKAIWDYVKLQRNANQIGPLGIRAGLDITELYTDAVKLDFFPDANMWIQVGRNVNGKNVFKDIFNQSDIDDMNMSMDVAYRALDKSKVDFEVYLVERTSWNVPYIFVTVIVDNKENDHLSYVRPNGLYWDKLVEKGLDSGIKTQVTFDPEMPIIEKDGSQVTRTMRYTPLSAMNVLDGYGYGNWCPQKGGDWAYYPDNPSGSGWPNQYQEVTPVCDGFVVDVKLFANLDVPTWNSTTFQLYNAGTQKRNQTYIGLGNQYGDFTDDYLVSNGITNPHALHFTSRSNPRKKIQGITVTFDEIGETNRWVHPVTGDLTPKGTGLTKLEKKWRNKRLDKIVFPY